MEGVKIVRTEKSKISKSQKSEKADGPIRVVILCGGRGTRFREQTEFIPKPMALIGNNPILWHIMKIYDHYGFKEFVLPLGYKGDMIKDFFVHYIPITKDITVYLKTGELKIHEDHQEDWTVHMVDTGQDSTTSKRLAQVKHLLKDSPYFMLTYGDGVADIPIDKLLEFHKKSGALVTISGFRPHHRFGIVEHHSGKVTAFKEKPRMQDLVNCGFMVFSNEALSYFTGQEIMLEELLPKIAADGKVAIYVHEGFWISMDTQRDFEELNEIWKTNPCWKVWD